VRACVLDDLLVRRTRTDIKKYYQTDANGIKFPQVKGPNLLKYEMSDELVQLFLDTMEKIAPFSTIKNEIVFEEGSLNYYRYRAIEYLVNQEDRNQYKNRNLNVVELAYGSDNAKALFQEMLSKASYEVGFDADDSPLMIEAVPLSNESIIIYVTKVDDPDELDTRFAKFSPTVADDVFASFDMKFNNLLEGALDFDDDKADESQKEPYLRAYSFETLDESVLGLHLTNDENTTENSEATSTEPVDIL